MLVTINLSPSGSEKEAEMSILNGCYELAELSTTHYELTSYPELSLTYNIEGPFWLLKNKTNPLIGCEGIAVYNIRQPAGVEISRYNSGYSGYITISKTACDVYITY